MIAGLSLAETIAIVEAGLEDVDRACGTYWDDPHGYHARRRTEMSALSARLETAVGARVNDRSDGARVRIAGRWTVPYDQAEPETKPLLMTMARLKHRSKTVRGKKGRAE